MEEKVYEYLKRLKLTKTHIFKFSPRKGTKAADMTEQVDGTVKETRSKALIELNAKNEGDFSKSLVGRDMDVLVEQEASKKPGVFEGYTRNYVKVEIINGNENMIGKIIPCHILEANGDYVVGNAL